MRNRDSRESQRDDAFNFSRINATENDVVDGNGRRSVALAQTGYFANRDPRVCQRKTLPKPVAKGVGAPHVTTQIGANSHRDFGLRLQVKDRVEAGHFVNPVERHSCARRHFPQFG